MSRIGGAIRDTISIENDAPRVNVWERGRPSFLVLLNARASNPGHSYLRLRRKCRPPSAPRVRLRTLNRTSYESRNAMTDESASDGGGCLCCPKRTGQTPARSLPRKENGKARTWMDEKSVRKSHGHYIPPAKGMGERALLLLGLLSLLTAADEVRHADAQHRATSNPSEGHAVKTGEREAGALLVPDGEGDSTAIDARSINKV